jgi:hypothetical protein
MIAGQIVEVLRRLEVQTLCTQGVRYECRTDEGPAQLDVRLSESASRLEILWSISGRIETLREHQIEVFGYDKNVVHFPGGSRVGHKMTNDECLKKSE